MNALAGNAFRSRADAQRAVVDVFEPLVHAYEAGGDPPAVQEMKDRIRAADAILVSTPEYNYSVPGVLKNAIDWASRPPRDSVLYHKPIGLMGASPGGFGTVRSQLALRQVFLFTKSYVMLEPEVETFNFS